MSTAESVWSTEHARVRISFEGDSVNWVSEAKNNGKQNDLDVDDVLQPIRVRTIVVAMECVQSRVLTTRAARLYALVRLVSPVFSAMRWAQVRANRTPARMATVH